MARRILMVLVVGVAALCVAFGLRPDPDARAQAQQEGCSVIFNFSGRAIDFVVPDGIEQVDLDIYGAAGGDTTGNPESTDNLGEGGFGAGVQNATLPVTPGATLTVIVGGEGGPADSPAGGNSRRT